MFSYRARGLAAIYSIVQASAAVLLFWTWMGMYFSVFRITEPASYLSYILSSLAVAAAFGADWFITRLKRADLVEMDLSGALRLATRQAITVLCAMLLCIFAMRDLAMSRLFLVSFIPALYLLLAVLNCNVPKFLAVTLFSARRRRATILLGSPSQAARISHWLRKKSHYGLDIVGMVSDDTEEGKGTPWRVLGGVKDLESVVHRTGATQVIALHLPNSIARAARIGRSCEQMGVRLLIVNDFEAQFQRPVHFFYDDGVNFVSMREEPLECPLNRTIKRAIDVAISLPVVAFVLPVVCAAVWLIHRWQSPGPLIFRQRRTGIQFEPFYILKFRTMHVTDADPAAQAKQGDTRIFPMGKWLRKLSLDELPQFINVLNGEMSVVGPRPHMVEHDGMFAKIADLYRIRSFVKPGITGLAQVMGYRGEAKDTGDVVERVRSDVFYLENWSLALDWLIILKTGWHVIRPPKTAY